MPRADELREVLVQGAWCRLYTWKLALCAGCHCYLPYSPVAETSACRRHTAAMPRCSLKTSQAGDFESWPLAVLKVAGADLVEVSAWYLAVSSLNFVWNSASCPAQCQHHCLLLQPPHYCLSLCFCFWHCPCPCPHLPGGHNDLRSGL